MKGIFTSLKPVEDFLKRYKLFVIAGNAALFLLWFYPLLRGTPSEPVKEPLVMKKREVPPPPSPPAELELPVPGSSQPPPAEKTEKPAEKKVKEQGDGRERKEKKEERDGEKRQVKVKEERAKKEQKHQNQSQQQGQHQPQEHLAEPGPFGFSCRKDECVLFDLKTGKRYGKGDVVDGWLIKDINLYGAVLSKNGKEIRVGVK